MQDRLPLADFAFVGGKNNPQSKDNESRRKWKTSGFSLSNTLIYLLHSPPAFTVTYTREIHPHPKLRENRGRFAQIDYREL